MIQKPQTDPIIEAIHEVRREISERFGGNVRAIAADANARMAASGCPVWKPADHNTTHSSTEATASPSDDQASPPGDR